MTGTYKKLRGLSLAVLMVLSVFAGTVALSGTALALGNAQLDNANAAAAQTSELSAASTIGANEANSFQNIRVDFSGASSFDGGFSQIDDQDVEIRIYPGEQAYASGNPSTTFSAGATVQSTNNNGATITVGLSNSQSVQEDQVVEAYFTQDFVNPTTSGNYDGDIDLNPGTDSDFSDATGTLTVAGSGGGGGGPSTPLEQQADAAWDDEVTRYQGQELYFNANNKQRDYQLRAVSDFDSTTGGYDSSSLARDLDDSGEQLIDTENLEGDYVITDGQGNYVQTNENGFVTDFISQSDAANSNSGADTGDQSTEIVVQTLTTEFDDDSVAAGDTVDLNFDSPVRGGYNVEISADGLDENDLENIFTGSGVSVQSNLQRDDNITVRVPGTDVDAEADFTDIDTGSYDFTLNVTDTSAKDTADIQVNEEDDVTADFARSSFVQERGDPVKMSIQLQETDEVTVVIGGEDVNFEQQATLEDDDDNDVVNFTFNSYLAGYRPAEEVFGVEDDAFVSGRTDNGVNSPLETGDYDVSAQIPSLNGEEKDLSVLTLTERSTDSAAVYTGPSKIGSSDQASYDDAEELRDEITQSSTVAEGNLIVLQVNASGVFGYPPNVDTPNTYLGDEDAVDAADYFRAGDETDDFDNSFSTANSVLGLSLIEEDVGPNADPQSVSIDNAEVYPDQDNDTLYAVFDPDNLPDGALEDGEEYNASFTVPEQNPYVDSGSDSVDNAETVYDTFEFQERELTFDTNDQGIVTVEAADNQTITGTTNIAPYTDITIRARASGEGAFLKTADVDVQPDGTFSGTFDFSDVPSNTSFDATVPSQGDPDDDAFETPGQVGSAQVGAATFSNQTFTGQATSLNVASVTVSEGGFVTIHDSTLVSDGAVFDSVRGTSEYLEEGTTENVTVELDSPIAPSGSGTYYAMPHLDSDGDETYDFVTSEGADDGPYVDGEGNPVTDAATITVERVATVTLNDQTTNGDSVLVESARLPDGGFVTIHDATVSDDPFGSVRGTSAYLDSGTSADINVSLDTPVEESGQFFAMPHRDTDGDETYDFVSSNGDDDGPYLNADGQIVLDSGQISLAGEMTATPTPTEADEPTPTEADEPTPTEGEETTTTSSDGQPGFGLAVSLIALVGAALIALRRRD